MGPFDERMGSHLILYIKRVPLSLFFKTHIWKREKGGSLLQGLASLSFLFFLFFISFLIILILFCIYLFFKLFIETRGFLFFYYLNISHSMTLNLILPYVDSYGGHDEWWMRSDLVVMGMSENELELEVWDGHWVEDRWRRRRLIFSWPWCV